MICDICGKNQATVHLTEIIDEKITELHICEECAKTKGAQMEQQFEFSDLLAGIAEFGGIAATSPEEEITDEQCTCCGMTYAHFKKIGRLGCPECYTTFKKKLIPLLKRIHGASQHLGKIPKKTAQQTKVMQEIKELKLKLQKAIETEDFEQAAIIRDNVKEIEEKSKQKGE